MSAKEVQFVSAVAAAKSVEVQRLGALQERGRGKEASTAAPRSVAGALLRP